MLHHLRQKAVLLLGIASMAAATLPVPQLAAADFDEVAPKVMGLYRAGKHAEAAPFIEDFVTGADREYGGDGRMVSVLFVAGIVYLKSEQPQKVEAVARRGLGLIEKYKDVDPQLKMVLRMLLGTACSQLGRPLEAEPPLRAALADYEKAFGPDHMEVGNVLNILGTTSLSNGKASEAITIFERMLRIREKQLGPTHWLIGISLNNLGNAYGDDKQPEKAEATLKRSVAILEKSREAPPAELATPLQGLGVFASNKKQHKEAEVFFRRAVKLRETGLPVDHPLTLDVINLLAVLLDDTGRSREAEALFRRVLAARQKKSPDSALALSMRNLASCLATQGRTQDAQPLFESALAVRTQVLGPEHADTLASLDRVGRGYSELHDWPQANAAYEKLLVAQRKKDGAKSTGVADALSQLAYVSKGAGELPLAEKYNKEALAMRESILGPEAADTAISLNNLALVYMAMGKPSDALPLLRRALAIRHKTLGPKHDQTIQSVEALAGMLGSSGQLAEARTLTQESLALRESVSGPDSPETAATLSNAGVRYGEFGDLKRAMECHQRALAIRERRLGPEHEETLLSLHNLGVAASEAGDLKQALLHLEKALKGREKVLGLSHRETAQTMDNLASVCRKSSQLERAEALYEGTLGIREKVCGPEHPDVADTLEGWGNLCLLTGEPARALTLFNRAYAIYEKAYGKTHPEIASVLNNRGIAHSDLGDTRSAEADYRRSLEIASALKVPPASHARTLGNLATLYHNLGRLQESRDMHAAALKTREEILGAEHPELAPDLINLSVAEMALKHYAAARDLGHRAMAITERALGSSHPTVGVAASNLALVELYAGDPSSAGAMLERAQSVEQKNAKKDEFASATILNNVGLYHQTLGDWGKARGYYERALAIEERKLPPAHPDIALCRQNLAASLIFAGDIPAASRLLQRALTSLEKSLGPDHLTTLNARSILAVLLSLDGASGKSVAMHEAVLASRERVWGKSDPSVLTSRNNLAFAHLFAGQPAKAIPLLEATASAAGAPANPESMLTVQVWENLALAKLAAGDAGDAGGARQSAARAVAGLSQFVHSHLHRLPEAERLSLGTLLFRSWMTAASVGDAALTAEAVLEFKGIVLDSLVAEQRLAAAAKDEATAALLTKRQALREAWHQASLKDADLARRNAAEVALSAVERELAQRTSRDLAARPVDRAAVEAALPQDAALVEFFHGPMLDFRHAAKSGGPDFSDSYHAVIIRRAQPPVLVSIGEVEAVDQAVKEYRAAIDADPTVRKKDTLKKACAALHGMLLLPLEKHLGGVTQLVISPDRQLHFVGFASLLDAQGRFACESRAIRMVNSGRDLLVLPAAAGPSKAASKNTALLVGSPLFQDNAPLAALTADAAAEAALPVPIAMRGEVPEFEPLPGTAVEIESVSKMLAASGWEVQALVGKDAAEPAMSTSVHGQTIVHLATHGFFLDATQLPAVRTLRLVGGLPPGMASSSTLTQDSPMFRSGLALAGARSTVNLWKAGRIPPPARDGILMASEAAGLNLTGTHLVVLSACDTALGEARDGEGVLGLRRALSQAGAESILMTLWPVSDDETVGLMKQFYERYLKDPTHPSNTLQEVQRDALIRLRTEVGVEDAILLAGPFVLTATGE